MVLDLVLDISIEYIIKEEYQLSSLLMNLITSCPAEVNNVSPSDNLIRGVLQVNPHDADSVEPLIELLGQLTIDETTVFSD